MNHQATPISSDELQRLRESHAELPAALQKYVDHFGDPLKCARAAIAKAQPCYHDDKASECADTHISTQPGDLDLVGRPLRAGS